MTGERKSQCPYIEEEFPSQTQEGSMGGFREEERGVVATIATNCI
jgi:hypothetical protein